MEAKESEFLTANAPAVAKPTARQAANRREYPKRDFNHRWTQMDADRSLPGDRRSRVGSRGPWRVAVRGCKARSAADL